MVRSLIPWSGRLLPKSMNRFERDMENLMERFFAEEGRVLPWSDGFAPRVSVAETEAAFEVTLELPGMKPEDFAIEMKGDELWISGSKKEEKEEKGKTYHWTERQYGEFRRAVPLTAAVKVDAITADYKEGVLKVVLPKAEGAKPKRIPVTG